MQRQLYKELWTMRFQKMLELERQGVRSYQAFLEECQSESKKELRLHTHFKKLISDEKKHVRLVQELLVIVGRQAD